MIHGRSAAYGYARLSAEGESMLSLFCRGRRVLDLGAGNGALSARMVELGASAVVAVEKKPMPDLAGVNHLHCLFSRMAIEQLPEWVVMSWPTNVVDPAGAAMVEDYLIRRAQGIFYVGQNDRFTVCGWPGLWRELARREVVAWTEVRGHNTIIQYGVRLPRPRTLDLLLLEEQVALTREDADARRRARVA